ncbi:MAG: transglutaminase domain-containing protein [bacterium]
MAKSVKNSRVLTIVIIVILAVWAGVMGVYLAKHRQAETTPQTPATSPGATVSPDEQWEKERWSGIYMKDTKIGYAVSRLQKEGDEYRVWYKLRVRLNMMGTRQDIRQNLRGRLDSRYRLKSYHAEIISPAMTLESKGHMEGNNLVMQFMTGGEKASHQLRFEHPVSLGTDWEIEARLADPQPGDKISVPVFEPTMSQKLPVTVEIMEEDAVKIGDRKVPAYKARMKMNSHTTWLWFSKDDNKIIKNYDPATGFVILLEGRQQALEVDWEKAESTDMLLSLRVPSSTAIIKPREVVYLKARLKNISLEELELSAAGRQTANGSTVEVRVESALPAKGYEIPIRDSLPDKAEEFRSSLVPSAHIQSDHRRIKQAAQKALDGATRAVPAVENLLSYMDSTMDKSMVYTIPSALEVLESKKGACKEHTILFTALCRAAGIPARPVYGIVYSEEMLVEGFYYHAWTEAYLAGEDGQGKWVAADPTFNQLPADAVHIKMGQGKVGNITSLMGVIGKLKVQVEEYH